MFKNMHVGVRIGTVVGFLLFLSISVSLFIINRMNALSNLTEMLYEHPFTVTRAVLTTNANIVRMHRSVRDIVLALSHTEIAKDSGLIDSYEKEVYKDFTVIDNRFLGDKKLYESALNLFATWKPIRDEIISLSLNGKREEAIAMIKGVGTPHMEKLFGVMEKLEDFAKNKALEFHNTTLTTKENAAKLSYLMIGLACSGGVGLSLLLIIKQNQVETALKNAETKYHTLFEGSPDGVVLIDVANSRWEDFNTKAYQQLGYTKEEFAHLSISDFEAMESPMDTQQHIAKLLAKGADILETIHRTKDGELRNVQVIAKTIRLEGKPFIHAIFRDITDQKKNDYQLQESEECFRRLFEESPVGVATYREDGQCVMANEAVAHITGATCEQLLQQNFRKSDTWLRAGIMEVALKALNTGLTEHFEANFLLPSGTRVDMDCDLVPIKINGKQHLMVFGNDVTHLRQAEIKMKEAKDAAENAAKIKSEFLSSMSHEIRTPLNAIIGLTRLALDTELNRKQTDYLRKILTSSMSLLNIINDILDFSKIEANRLKIENIDIILEETLENTMSLFVVKAEEKGLKISCEVDKDVPAVITGDPYRLGQVLNNVIGNAVKFTEKGEIHLKVETAERSEKSCVLRFTVKDTGIGISSEQIKILFTPFQQADGSISRKYGGTGLGLTISKKLVNLMGGDISVSSESGKGSTFVFTVRFGTSISQDLKGDFVNLHAMKTLVVDDSPTSLEVLNNFLESWKFDVTLCMSGEECLRQLELADKAEKPFQLLLLDWIMPNMTGLEVAMKIKENVSQGRLTISPTVIMITGYGQYQFQGEAVDVKLDAVLTKPLRASKLYNTILRLQQPGIRKFVTCPFLEDTLCQSTKSIQGARILLVEDNDINQQVAFEMLSKTGFNVVVANNGYEALKMVENEAFNGILMDLQMPGMDGYQTTSLIRAKPDCKDIPIIAMSAAVMEEDKQKCLSVGMVDHVAKPIMPEALVGALLKWVKPAKQGFVATSPDALPASEAYDVPLNLPDFNLWGAIKRIGGNKKLLCTLLHQFSDDYSSVIERLDTLSQAGDVNGTLMVLHSLRGVSGTLGMSLVYDHAVQLENRVKAGEFPVSLDMLKHALQEALITIAQVVEKPEEPINQHAEYNHEDVTHRLNELASSLKKYKVYPKESLIELTSRLATKVDAELLSKLGKHIDNFNYKGALEAVYEIAGNLNVTVNL
ncbi:MAG: response regulator [Candidatus Brocadiaceae bacterium]|nr:response regulator [Candidatus Brocadiaceae bacterium]